MSLARLLRSAEARVLLDLLRPPAPRLEGTMLPPARLAPPLAASAVANGLRVELVRRDPRARGVWLAEHAPERLESIAPEMVDAARRALAFACEGADREVTDPSLAAARALQLARLEAVVRAGYVDARLGEPEDADEVAEVADMLARIPWANVGSRALPPPLFERSTDAFPDGEPDALVDGMLLAVSASRAPRIDDDEVRALVARLVLARLEWGPELAAERIRSIGVLLARHGIMWRVPVEPILRHEAFPSLEAWMRERVEKAFRQARPADTDDGTPRGKALPAWVKKRFAKKAPMTHPEGKAAKKKSHKSAPERPAPPTPPRAPRAPRESEPDESPGTSKKQRPDWRKNSPWRRERGL